MSSKRKHDPDSPLCRFAFADGRHCALPAHPECDGLCYTHGTLAPRASRQDNFRRELSSLADGSTSATDFRRASRALSRALAQRRISPEKAAALIQISNLLRQSGRYAQEESFHSARGTAWDAIRQLLDGPALNP